MALSFFSRLSLRATTPFSCTSSCSLVNSTLGNVSLSSTTWLLKDQTNASMKAFLATKSKEKKSSNTNKSNAITDSKMTSVVLLEEIPRGMKGEIIKVARGYARNYLLPLRKAVRATPENIKLYSQEITPEVLAARERNAKEKQARRRIPKMKVEIKRHVMPDGSLHSAITPAIIVEKMIKQYQFPLEEASVLLPTPLTTLGKHAVNVRLGEVVVDLQVEVVKR
eukprot:TRINITY_DN16665_c0_g1_i1.p1 TRINITY_DN16665_c0_g1~~TRINITY_DN16665_c0_g1_i1.p1  ORF type:complete len:224 (-),score=50.80 TRINITY_DN16665_c0_g1_i1:140-811(-)